MPGQSVILLAFSNDHEKYLPDIVEEQKAIKSLLLDHADKNYLHVRDIQRASTEELFYLINRYHNQVVLLHYAGHADGEGLQLEKEIGIVQVANAKGIAGLLGTQQKLKLVFLNGCATRGQVQVLLDKGVPAVIATSVKVNDDQAKQFATQFYQALVNGQTLRDAFLKAKAFLETGQSPPAIADIGRGPDMEAMLKKDKKLPWGVYFKAGEEGILNWRLPAESSYQLDFSTEGPAKHSHQLINSVIVDSTLKAIRASTFVKELARKIHKERNAGDKNRKPTDAEKKDAIIRSFLAPVSVHLRTLFSHGLSEKQDEKRLRQLLTTYQRSMEMFTFILLSDIWDATHKKEGALHLNDDEKMQLQAFWGLNEFTCDAFDYFHLLCTLLQLAKRNGITFYFSQLSDYKENWSQLALFTQAHNHFQLIKTALEEDIPSRLIEPYCIASEQHLTHLLCEWHYMINYKMAVVKNIEVQKIKNLPPPTFKHVLVELDNNYNDIGRKDRWQNLTDATDMESVLLYKNTLSENLNLSPFILDENALNREFNSKIYFFSHQTTEGLVYKWIEYEEDTLLVHQKNYPAIIRQFEKARQEILNEEVAVSKPSDMEGEDDIMSVM
jgi:hypothetical protein